jgi:hypothetical protein
MVPILVEKASILAAAHHCGYTLAGNCASLALKHNDLIEPGSQIFK